MSTFNMHVGLCSRQDRYASSTAGNSSSSDASEVEKDAVKAHGGAVGVSRQ